MFVSLKTFPAGIQVGLRMLLLVAGIGSCAFVAAQQDDPYSKTFDDFEWNENEERIAIPGSLPVGTKVPTKAAIALFERQVQENSEDTSSLSILGQLYFRHAKEADDLPYYARAAQTLEQAIRLEPDYPAAKLHLAHVYASQHRFLEALKLASEVRASQPHSALALAIVSDCQLELGRYDEAKASLDILLKIEQSPPIQARLARYAELTGDTDQALASLDQALAGLESLGAPAEETTWYLWRKASLLFGRGEVPAAKRLYQKVLEIDSDDSAALFGLAEVQRASGEVPQAIETVQKIIDDSQAPPAMAFMGDLHAISGNQVVAEQWYQKTEAAMRAEMVVAGDAHAREVAMFFADHQRNLDEALALATKDLERRQDIYSYDTLAWCQYQAGEVSQAANSIKQALRLGTQDAKLFFHAAQIFAANGQAIESKAMLARAIKLNADLAR